MNARRFCLVLLIALVTGVSVPVRAQISFDNLKDKLKQGVDVATEAPQPGQPTTAPLATAAPAPQPPAAAGQGAPAQAQEKQGTWYYCLLSVSAHDSIKPKIYISGVFRADDGKGAITLAWSRFITNYIINKHAPDQEHQLATGSYSCSPEIPGTTHFHDAMRNGLSRGGEAIDVDWKYTPDQGVRPPAESPSELSLGYCSSNSVKPPIYVSDIFATNISVQGGSTLQIANDYYQYLKQKYAYKNTSNYPVGCPIFRSRSSAEASKQKLETQWKQSNQEVIETGWKWVIPPGTPVQRPLGP